MLLHAGSAAHAQLALKPKISAAFASDFKRPPNALPLRTFPRLVRPRQAAKAALCEGTARKASQGPRMPESIALAIDASRLGSLRLGYIAAVCALGVPRHWRLGCDHVPTQPCAGPGGPKRE